MQRGATSSQREGMARAEGDCSRYGGVDDGTTSSRC